MVYFLLNKIKIKKASNQDVPYSVVGLSRVMQGSGGSGLKEGKASGFWSFFDGFDVVMDHGS